MNDNSSWKTRIRVFKTVTLLVFLVFSASAQTNAPAGKIVWWGRNQRLGFNDANGVVENEGEIVTNAVAVSANVLGALAQTSDGKVLDFELHPNDENKIRPGLSNVVSVVAERNSSWAIRQDGTAAIFGVRSPAGFVGLESNVVANLTNIASIAGAGSPMYLALKSDGTALGFRLDSPRIQQVTVRGQILSNVVALASLDFTPLVLKKDGSVLRLGYQTPGAPPVKSRAETRNGHVCIILGGESQNLPYQYTSADPVLINGLPLTNVVALSSGLALKADGTVAGWKMNWDTESVEAAPTPAGLHNLIAIAGGNMALKSDGSLVSWGNDGSETADAPSGLSNVAAIAVGNGFKLAVTTGNIPAGVFVKPYGRLEEMAREADVIFKGHVTANTKMTNANIRSMHSLMAADATEFDIISVLKGPPLAKFVFRHVSGIAQLGDMDPPEWPEFYKFEPGQSYLVFAAKSGRTNGVYSSPGVPDDFWMLPCSTPYCHHGVIHTLDARPVNGLSASEAYWQELKLLLYDSNPENELFAIEKLDRLSTPEQAEKWRYPVSFKRHDVLGLLFPMTMIENKKVAKRAASCFPNQK